MDNTDEIVDSTDETVKSNTNDLGITNPSHNKVIKTIIDTPCYFSDFFQVPEKALEEHGAFNISLINDLPLFIDPFLLFNSNKPEYKELHDEVIRYVAFLRDRSKQQGIDKGLMRAWFLFPEVRQNWLGYSKTGNRGHGLGPKFGEALNENLHTVFSNFGKEEDYYRQSS